MSLLHVLDDAIRAERATLLELAARLVRAPSMSPPGHTAAVAAEVLAYLRQAGLSPQVVAAEASAPNVVAEVEGTGSGPHVVFNAHMDTMQAGDETAWTVPVLDLTRRDGKVFGLGMGNMKGALAAMCLATAVLNRHRHRFAGKLTMTAVCDEVMFGERGTVHLLRARPDLAGDYLISGEGPGFMQLAPAEKGLLWLDVQAQGMGGHSSRALEGRTAAMRLAVFLSRLDRMNSHFAVPPAQIKDISGGEGNLGMRLSANVGAMSAGEVRSLIAEHARAEIDFRLPPGISAAEVQSQVNALAQEIGGLSVTVVKAWDANWTAFENPLVTTIRKVATEIRGVPPELVVRLPGSDARRWRDLGTPAVCYGPQPTLSAGVDDYANEQDLIDCAVIYARTAIGLMGIV
ncbi:ArgE/DapE family deacylase [Pigmentiphaga soli]|uniref:ArgE/DapE family deacylase n=1 Tax=Pigmentiphaga soli TaxID=1007095 RepID=A0ABP8GG48_9BURK